MALSSLLPVDNSYGENVI